MGGYIGIAIIVLAIAWMIIFNRSVARSEKEKAQRDQEGREGLYKIYMAYTEVLADVFELCPESQEAIKIFSTKHKDVIITAFLDGLRMSKDYTMGWHTILVAIEIIDDFDLSKFDKDFSPEVMCNISEDFYKIKTVDARENGLMLDEFFLLQTSSKTKS